MSTSDMGREYTRRRLPGVHVHRQPVRFGDCDPAGIVYYPRLLHFFHEAMETWFLEALGYPYHEMIVGRSIGFPCVHCHADFSRPNALGDVLAVELRVAEMGRSSLRFDYQVFPWGIGGDQAARAGSLRLSGGTVCVVMDLDPQSASFRRAVAIPPGLRAAIAGFMGAPSPGEG